MTKKLKGDLIAILSTFASVIAIVVTSNQLHGAALHWAQTTIAFCDATLTVLGVKVSRNLPVAKE